NQKSLQRASGDSWTLDSPGHVIVLVVLRLLIHLVLDSFDSPGGGLFYLSLENQKSPQRTTGDSWTLDLSVVDSFDSPGVEFFRLFHGSSWTLLILPVVDSFDSPSDSFWTLDS
ncbi:25457_t:CDS:2, partial [Gigaspora rosea]